MQGIEGRVTGNDGVGIGRARRTGDGAAIDVEVRFAPRAPTDGDQLLALIQKLLVRNQQLEQALESRVVIEQAKGVLAERLALDPERAFELLRRAARNNRIKIHDLAARVVTERETPSEVQEALR